MFKDFIILYMYIPQDQGQKPHKIMMVAKQFYFLNQSFT